MFYFFWHMPKCGGTSFRYALNKILTVHNDYHPTVDVRSDKYLKYKNSALNLEKMSENDCVVGHYNITGTKLWERYPSLDKLEHKKFTILRDPYEAAVSGVRYNVKLGIISKNQEVDYYIEKLMLRVNYFSKVMGVNNQDEIREIKNRFWRIVSLDNAQNILDEIFDEQIVLHANNKISRPFLTKENTSNHINIYFDECVKKRFKHESRLDYFLYDELLSK